MERKIKFLDAIGCLVLAHILFGAIAYFDPNVDAAQILNSMYFTTAGFLLVYFLMGRPVKDNGNISD